MQKSTSKSPIIPFIETSEFSKRVDSFKDPDLLKTIQDVIGENPEGGVNLKCGIRKVRVPSPERQQGKRGGYRVWYYYQSEVQGRLVIYLLFVLDKKDAENINKKQEDKICEALKYAIS